MKLRTFAEYIKTILKADMKWQEELGNIAHAKILKDAYDLVEKAEIQVIEMESKTVESTELGPNEVQFKAGKPESNPRARLH